MGETYSATRNGRAGASVSRPTLSKTPPSYCTWVGADGAIPWANQAEPDLLGYVREEYIGRKIIGFHADPDAINDILRRLMNRETLHDYEARLRCKDGSVRHVFIKKRPLRLRARRSGLCRERVKSGLYVPVHDSLQYGVL